MSAIEVTSRYDVFGPPNGCADQCEGTAWIPIYMSSGDRASGGVRPTQEESDPVFRWLWVACDTIAKEPVDDGYRFVPCPSCNEKGLRFVLHSLMAVTP